MKLALAIRDIELYREDILAKNKNPFECKLLACVHGRALKMLYAG